MDVQSIKQVAPDGGHTEKNPGTLSERVNQPETARADAASVWTHVEDDVTRTSLRRWFTQANEEFFLLTWFLDHVI